jgi:hypothetical protein
MPYGLSDAAMRVHEIASSRRDRILIAHGKNRSRLASSRVRPRALGAGTRSTGGYEARILGITLGSGRLRVTTRLNSPGASCFLVLGTTRPFAMVAFTIPRSAIEAVTYLRHDRVRECSSATCASTRCPGDTYCTMRSGRPSCERYETCASTNRVCLVGSRCVDLPTVCIAGSQSCLPPSVPACVENRCADLQCRAGEYCEVGSWGAVCVPYRTCADPIVCFPGTHCEDRLVVCIAGSSSCPPPTRPECVSN